MPPPLYRLSFTERMNATVGVVLVHFVRKGYMVALSVLIFVATRDVAEARSPRVGVLRSGASLRVSGWMGAWETDGSVGALRSIGLDVRALTDNDLEQASMGGLDVLVVPGSRCVSRSGAMQVARWVNQGGRLLATGMASYRDENNRSVTADNDFQWAPLYGASFQRWLGAWPHCEYLALDDDLARDVGVALGRKPARRIQLGRNTAMLVRASPETHVLATWLSADGQTPTTDSGSASAAIVQRGRVIYAGENLLAPELSRSPEVRALLLSLLHRLDPDFPTRLASQYALTPGPLHFPGGPTVTVKAGGPTLRVGIHSQLPLVGMAARTGLVFSTEAGNLERTSPRKGGREPWLRSDPDSIIEAAPVAPAPGTPYVALYERNRVIVRSSSPLLVRARSYGDCVQFLQLRPNGTCRVQAFRGSIELLPREGRMAAVNILSAEEYVAGVVPNETPAIYPQEALKAMSVVARTFGLSRRGYHSREGYDVCNTVDCQVYGGYLTEWDNVNNAVNDTRREVIRYGDRLADATFHAVCGGIGEDVEKVWPQSPTPYLVGQPDGPAPIGDLSSDEAFGSFLEHPPDSYCKTSPRFRWRETYTLQQLQSLLAKSLPVTLGSRYHGLGTLRTVRVSSRSPHGRVMEIQIEGTLGTYSVEKDRIRWLWSAGLVGQGGLQSTLFRIVANPGTAGPDGTVEFQGGGWGHGVGMCQDGAAGLATRGRDYRAIILHYYPNTDIVTDIVPL